MKHFSHDNIVQLYGVCTTNEPVYIVMELMIHGGYNPPFLLGIDLDKF